MRHSRHYQPERSREFIKTVSELVSKIEQPGIIDCAAAWYGRDLQKDDSWIEHLCAVEIDELLGAVEQVNARGISMLEMKQEDFPLPTLTPRLRGLARELDHGRGFWLLRGLPIDNLSERDAAFAYWGMGLHLGSPVSQNARVVICWDT